MTNSENLKRDQALANKLTIHYKGRIKSIRERQMAKKSYKQYFNYKCTITEEEFRVTKKSENPEELVSVNAYYELHPDEDDRPEAVKKQLGLLED
jgi:hypothetical protein